MAEQRVTQAVEQVLMSQAVASTNIRVTQAVEQALFSSPAEVRVTAVYMSVLQSRAGRLAPVITIGYGRP